MIDKDDPDPRIRGDQTMSTNIIIFQLGTKFSYRRDRDQPWVNATVYDIDASTNRLYAELDKSADMWPRIILNMSDPNLWDQIGTPF